jgi:hypothetical protein
MSPDEFRQHGHEVVDWIADYLASPGSYPVLPDVKPGGLIDALPDAGPENSEPMAVLKGFETSCLPHALNHPGFMDTRSPRPGGIWRDAGSRAQRQRDAVADVARRYRARQSPLRCGSGWAFPTAVRRHFRHRVNQHDAPIAWRGVRPIRKSGPA